MWNMWNMHGWGLPFSSFGFMIIGGIIRLALFGLVIYFLIKFIKIGAGNNSTAIEILKQRYASGEISKEEYEEKLKILKK